MASLFRNNPRGSPVGQEPASGTRSLNYGKISLSKDHMYDRVLDGLRRGKIPLALVLQRLRVSPR